MNCSFSSFTNSPRGVSNLPPGGRTWRKIETKYQRDTRVAVDFLAKRGRERNLFRRRGNRLTEINNGESPWVLVRGTVHGGDAEETREDTRRPVSPTKGLTIANSLMSRAFIVSRLPYRGFNSGSVARGERVKGGEPEEDARSREGEGDRNTGTDLLFRWTLPVRR